LKQVSAALRSIASMLRGHSIEVHPGETKVVDLAPERLDPGTEVFLTWIPGSNPMDMIEPAAKLRHAGLVPVPHVCARHIETAEQLERFAKRLAGEAGVDRVLIIGGDRPKPAGPFDSSLGVMQSGAFQRAGISRISVAGFPEGNPHIPEHLLQEALQAKLRFARGEGLQLSIVTQFCFDALPIVGWLCRLRAQHVDTPVRVGLAGPAGLMTLARYAVRCGIGNSLHVLAENTSFAKLLVEKGPEPIIRGIAPPAEETSGDALPEGVAGLHFFVFGGFKKTVDWIDAQRAQ
jgi:methylenetetrahydrofolate reductase (NADPH)